MPSLVLFYGIAYSLSALHDSVVPFEEVVCAFHAPIYTTASGRYIFFVLLPWPEAIKCVRGHAPIFFKPS